MTNDQWMTNGQVPIRNLRGGLWPRFVDASSEWTMDLRTRTYFPGGPRENVEQTRLSGVWSLGIGHSLDIGHYFRSPSGVQTALAFFVRFGRVEVVPFV